jgi:hypothetical protein
MQDDFKLEQTIKVYLNIRDAIEEMEERHKAELKDLRDQFEVVGNYILDFCNSQNLDSIRTKAGTVTRRVNSRYWTSDWDSMYRVIKEHDAFHLLHQRIHDSNMRKFIEENPESFPPGLNATSSYVVQIRKPTEK